MSLFKHIGCPKKRFKFEMRIHRVVLTSEKRKLFTRVLWTRGKEKKQQCKYRTNWCEGVENFNFDESIYHEATIYFSSLSSSNQQVQPKQTKITLQIRERIDSKDQKFGKFDFDLASYVDVHQPHRTFYQRLNFEKARKKAQLIFTVKCTEIKADGSHGTLSDYTDDDDNDTDADTQSNYNTDGDVDDGGDEVLSETTLNTLQNAMNMQTFNAMTTSSRPAVVSTGKQPQAPKRHSAPNLAHSNVSGKQLKTRHYRNHSTMIGASAANTKTRIETVEEMPPLPPLPPLPGDDDDARSSNITIVRRDNSSTATTNVTSAEMRSNSPTACSSSASEDILELQRKLKLYEDKHRKYKYKYARLHKKAEEQEIEIECQREQICALKRVEEGAKDHDHVLSKYKKKIKLLGKQASSLRGMLQKRNQTIIHLNKENSRMKHQIATLQSCTADVQSDDDVNDDEDEDEDNVTEYHPDAMKTEPSPSRDGERLDHDDESGQRSPMYEVSVTIVDKDDDGLSDQQAQPEQSISVDSAKIKRVASPPPSGNGKEEDSISVTLSVGNHAVAPHTTPDGGDHGLGPEDRWQTKTKSDSLLSEIQSQWMQAETEKLNFKKLYEKEQIRGNEYRASIESAQLQCQQYKIELDVARLQREELEQKHEVMQEVYLKLKHDLTRLMDRYSKLEYENERLQQQLQTVQSSQTMQNVAQ